MAHSEPRSLLNDILAASTQPPAAAKSDSTPIATRSRNELEDLLRLTDTDWLRFLADIAPDDLVVVCSDIVPAWRERVIASLDTVSQRWLQDNVSVLDKVAPILRTEARNRVMGIARRLLRDGTISLPDSATQPAATLDQKQESQSEIKPPDQNQPSQKTPPDVHVSIVAPTHSVTPAATTMPESRISSVSMSFGMPSTSTSTSTPPAYVEDSKQKNAAALGDPGLDAIFADLQRLRNQSGVTALAQLAKEVPDPFLKSGLCLIAAGLPLADLERTLDSALARHAQTYIDTLIEMRGRLLELAKDPHQ